MKPIHLVVALAISIAAVPAFAADAEVTAAQATIDAQIKAFLRNDDQTAYSYAAPNITNAFPTTDGFMAMVKRAYQPVWHPQSYTFGKAEETSPTSVVQQVMVVGPDGKYYRAVYTLERQSDGKFQITGVSLQATNALST